jgi:hypothetical protein
MPTHEPGSQRVRCFVAAMSLPASRALPDQLPSTRSVAVPRHARGRAHRDARLVGLSRRLRTSSRSRSPLTLTSGVRRRGAPQRTACTWHLTWALFPSRKARTGLLHIGGRGIDRRLGSPHAAALRRSARRRNACAWCADGQPRGRDRRGHRPISRRGGGYERCFTALGFARGVRSQRAGELRADARPRGWSVVVDASFRSRAWGARSRDLARSLRVRFHFVECRAPLEVCHARLARRKGGPSDGRLDVFDNFAARFEPVDEFPAREHVVVDVVDTSRDQATLLAKVRELLGNWPPGSSPDRAARCLLFT